jgi:hypothetical protein
MLLAVHGALLAWAAAANSATFDEPVHLAAGCAYWLRGDFTIYSLSPPLLRLWAALPAVLAGANAPDTAPVWDRIVAERHWYYNDPFVYANLDRFALLLRLARFGMIPLSLAGAWVTYRWASQLYGVRSGLAACAMYCFNPSILAHGSLATTDLGTTTAIVAACWLWWRFSRSPSWGRWAWVCALVAVAHLCKFTAVLLWFMMPAMALPMCAKKDWTYTRKLVGGWLGAGVVTLLILNAAYGFRGSGRPLGSMKFYSSFMLGVQRALPYYTPSPLPRTLIEGFDAQKLDTESNYQGFLFGSEYRGSRWFYYPLALSVKLPVAMILLGAAAAFSIIRPGRKWARDVGDEVCLLEAIFVYLAGVMVLSEVNIGTRYLLPAFPLLIIAISRLWMKREDESGHRGLARARWALVGMLVVETLWVCPRFLAFINFAGGGPDNGVNLLSDSDFDWGQSLIDLRHWMDDHKVHSVVLAYFGLIDPQVYGIQFSPLTTPDNSRYVAISSYYLHGSSNRMVVGFHKRAYLQVPYFRELRGEMPTAIVGHTIFIYTRPAVAAAARLNKGGQ